MKRLALLAGGTVLALLLAACGGNAEKKADQTQPQQPEMMQEVQPAAPAPAAEENKAAGTEATAPAAATEEGSATAPKSE